MLVVTSVSATRARRITISTALGDIWSSAATCPLVQPAARRSSTVRVSTPPPAHTSGQPLRLGLIADLLLRPRLGDRFELAVLTEQPLPLLGPVPVDHEATDSRGQVPGDALGLQPRAHSRTGERLLHHVQSGVRRRAAGTSDLHQPRRVVGKTRPAVDLSRRCRRALLRHHRSRASTDSS